MLQKALKNVQKKETVGEHLVNNQNYKHNHVPEKSIFISCLHKDLHVVMSHSHDSCAFP